MNGPVQAILSGDAIASTEAVTPRKVPAYSHYRKHNWSNANCRVDCHDPIVRDHRQVAHVSQPKVLVRPSK